VRPLLEQHEDRVVETQLRAVEVWMMTWDRMDVRVRAPASVLGAG
jgi:hypothetical protein